MSHRSGSDDFSGAVGRKAEKKSAAGNGRKSLAGAAKETVARTLEKGGRYLRSEGLEGMADDLSQVIRRHPLPAVFVAIGLGYFLARLTNR